MAARVDRSAVYRHAAFGKRVRDLRLERGWTQEEFAHRLGWDRKTINRIETGANAPVLTRVFDMAIEFGVPTSSLFPK